MAAPVIQRKGDWISFIPLELEVRPSLWWHHTRRGPSMRRKCWRRRLGPSYLAWTQGVWWRTRWKQARLSEVRGTSVCGWRSPPRSRTAPPSWAGPWGETTQLKLPGLREATHWCQFFWQAFPSVSVVLKFKKNIMKERWHVFKLASVLVWGRRSRPPLTRSTRVSGWTEPGGSSGSHSSPRKSDICNQIPQLSLRAIFTAASQQKGGTAYQLYI